MPATMIHSRAASTLAAIAILATVAPILALGQEAETGGAPDADRPDALDDYRIELIVFEYGDALAGTREDWPRIGQTESEPEAGDEGAEEQAEPEVRSATVAEFRFSRVPRSAYELDELAQRLSRTSGYRPLLHVAWEQPGYSRADARPLDLARLAALPQRLQGEVRLYRSRFLHLVVDLSLLADDPGAVPAAIPAMGSAGDALETLEPRIYRLRESRKLKSGELHYFDHPRYGLLARVTPVEPESVSALSGERP